MGRVDGSIQGKWCSAASDTFYILVRPRATLNSWIFTRSYEPHNIVTTFNGAPLQTFTFDNSQWWIQSQSDKHGPCLWQSLIADNTLNIKETNPSTSGNQNLVMYSEILYPRKYDFADG
jgi:hypothetical protein